MLTPIRKYGHPQVTNESSQGIIYFPLVKCTTVKDPGGKSDKGRLGHAAVMERRWQLSSHNHCC